MNRCESPNLSGHNGKREEKDRKTFSPDFCVKIFADRLGDDDSRRRCNDPQTTVRKQPSEAPRLQHSHHQPWPLGPKWKLSQFWRVSFGGGRRRSATESCVLTRQSVYIPEGNFSPLGWGAEQGGGARHVVGACQWWTGQPALWRHLDMCGWYVQTHTHTGRDLQQTNHCHRCVYDNQLFNSFS